MKRVLSLILAIVLALSCVLALSSCAAEVSYEDFHEKAVEAQAKLYKKSNKQIDEDTVEIERIKGKIQPGMLADFVILGGNPFAVPANEITVEARGEKKSGTFYYSVYEDVVAVKSAEDEIEWYANLYVPSIASLQVVDLFYDFTYKAGAFGFEVTDGTVVKKYNRFGLLTHYENGSTIVDIKW